MNQGVDLQSYVHRPREPPFPVWGTEEESTGQDCCWGRITGKRSPTTPLGLSLGSWNLTGALYPEFTFSTLAPDGVSAGGP